MSSVESWRRAALAAYVLAGAALASGGYALATTQANVNAIAAAQKRLDDDEWSKHQAHAKTDSARSAAIINIFLTKSSIAHVATVTFHFSYITFLFLLAQTHLL